MRYKSTAISAICSAQFGLGPVRCGAISLGPTANTRVAGGGAASDPLPPLGRATRAAAASPAHLSGPPILQLQLLLNMDATDGANCSAFSNPCLDLFVVDPNTVGAQRLRDLLAAAWAHDAAIALKLVYKLCGADDKKSSFYTAAVWMHKYHPRTLVDNLAAFVQLGCAKNLPKIIDVLVRIAKTKAAAEKAPLIPLAGRKRARARRGEGFGFRRSKRPRWFRKSAVVEAASSSSSGSTEVVQNVGSLPLPYEIVVSLVKRGATKIAALAPWNSWLGDLRRTGSLTNCLAVCDVSKNGLGISDDGKLMKVCVALGLLISDSGLGVTRWSNWVHAFSESSAPHHLSEDRGEAAKSIHKMQCDERFDLTKVFEWVLLISRRTQPKPDEMVKTIFVFTHKSFDQALRPPHLILNPQQFSPTSTVRPWRDEYLLICSKFKDAGFFDVPQVVFWNLKGPRSAAMTSTKDGVMRLSGYSDELLRIFLENDGIVEPEDEMYATIAGEAYRKLIVKD